MPAHSRPVAVGEAYSVGVDVEDSSAERTFAISYRDLGGREHQTQARIVGPGGLGGTCELLDVEVQAAR